MTKTATVTGTTWGLPLAVNLARNGHKVRLWEYSAELARRLAEARRVDKFPGLVLPDAVEVTDRLPAGDEVGDLLLVVVPSEHVRNVVGEIGPLPDRTLVGSASKGLEVGSCLRMSQVIAEAVAPKRLAVLSGPTIAREVASGVPTTAVAASDDPADAEALRSAVMTDTFRVYTGDDVVGVELGGALKNVIAIAAGICDGLGFGDNTKAALVTRGAAEMARLGAALGARRETFAGLSGIGDLVVTAFSPHSRNRRLGEAIAKGVPLEEAQAALGEVAEGVRTTISAMELAGRAGVEMPITEQVHRVLFEGKSPRDAVRDLMIRRPKPELDELQGASGGAGAGSRTGCGDDRR